MIVIDISGHIYHVKRWIKTSRCFLARRKYMKFFERVASKKVLDHKCHEY